jgi:hypothetical protein
LLFFGLAEDAKSEKEESESKNQSFILHEKKRREEPRPSSPAYLSSR